MMCNDAELCGCSFIGLVATALTDARAIALLPQKLWRHGAANVIQIAMLIHAQ